SAAGDRGRDFAAAGKDLANDAVAHLRHRDGIRTDHATVAAVHRHERPEERNGDGHHSLGWCIEAECLSALVGERAGLLSRRVVPHWDRGKCGEQHDAHYAWYGNAPAS